MAPLTRIEHVVGAIDRRPGSAMRVTLLLTALIAARA